MVNNVGSKIKCGLLMNNMKSPNNVFIANWTDIS